MEVFEEVTTQNDKLCLALFSFSVGCEECARLLDPARIFVAALRLTPRFPGPTQRVLGSSLLRASIAIQIFKAGGPPILLRGWNRDREAPVPTALYNIAASSPSWITACCLLTSQPLGLEGIGPRGILGPVLSVHRLRLCSWGV